MNGIVGGLRLTPLETLRERLRSASEVSGRRSLSEVSRRSLSEAEGNMRS